MNAFSLIDAEIKDHSSTLYSNTLFLQRFGIELHQKKELHIKVCGAKNVYGQNGGPTDSYVQVSFGEQMFSTSVQKKRSDPVWNQEFIISCKMKSLKDNDELLSIKLIKKNPVRKDIVLGYYNMLPSTLKEDSPLNSWLALSPDESNRHLVTPPELHIQLCLKPSSFDKTTFKLDRKLSSSETEVRTQGDELIFTVQSQATRMNIKDGSGNSLFISKKRKKGLMSEIDEVYSVEEQGRLLNTADDLIEGFDSISSEPQLEKPMFTVKHGKNSYEVKNRSGTVLKVKLNSSSMLENPFTFYEHKDGNEPILAATTHFDSWQMTSLIEIEPTQDLQLVLLSYIIIDHSIMH